MRAILFRSYGGPEKLELADLPRPTPGAGQLLVAVKRSSVNPVDWKIGSGKVRLFFPVTLPAVPGFDVVGEVVELGPGVTGYAVGALIHARIAGGSGAASADFALVETTQAVPVPTGMGLDEAAGLPLAGMTALQGLRDRGALPMSGATQSVLIIGASGGVGHLAVQIAKATGAKVTGVCSARNAARVRELGADDVIDYTQPDAWNGKGPWDIVYDCVGGDPGPHFGRVAKGGRYLSCVPGGTTFFWAAFGFVRGVKVAPVMLKSNAADLRVLDGLYTAGKLRVLIDSTWPLGELKKAWERSLSGRSVGKIIVEVA